MRDIVKHNAAWKYYLSASGSRYVELYYEEVVGNISATINKIGQLMNIKTDNFIMSNDFNAKIQRTKLNQEWANRFLSEYNNSEFLKHYKLKLLLDRLKNFLKRMLKS